MNKYRHLAMRHWQTTDPDRHRAIPETAREALFTQLGEHADTEIQQLQDALAGPDPRMSDSSWNFGGGLQVNLTVKQ